MSTSDLTHRNKHRVVFVLGGPGAGKGTQCENIVEHYKCVHLSVGELLRNAKENSPYADLIEECLVAGKIVPVEISLSLLRDAMDRAAASEYGAPIFLVDGFPRNFDNLQGWVNTTARSANMPDYASVLGALVFDCPVEELERRILERAKTSGRSDDNLTSARKRFATFKEQTAPVVRVLEQLCSSNGGDNTNVVRVAHIAGQHSIEEVWGETRRQMDAFAVGDVLSANARLILAVENRDVEEYLKVVDNRMLADDDDDLSTPTDSDNASEGAETGPSQALKKAFHGLEVVSGGEVGSEKQTNQISNVKVQFHDGTSTTVVYDRVISLPDGEVLSKMHETRVWKHGSKGWLNVHFVRSAVQ